MASGRYVTQLAIARPCGLWPVATLLHIADARIFGWFDDLILMDWMGG